MWFEKYVGLPYVKGEYDCAEFARCVLHNELRLDIPIPSERSWRGKDAQSILDFGNEFVFRTDEPRDFDAVVMRIRGDRLILGSHVGLFAINGGIKYVIHCMSGIGVIMTQVGRLSAINLELEGFYRWKTL